MDRKNGLQRKISMEPRKRLFPVIEIMLAVTILVGCRLPSMIFGTEGDSQDRLPTSTASETVLKNTANPQPTATPEPFFDMTLKLSDVKVYHLMARLSTTSDWTRVLFEGVDAAGVDHTVLQGADQPNLDIRRIPELRITRSGGTGETVEVEYDLYLNEIKEETIRIGIGKGHLGRTDLELYIVNDEERIPLETMVHTGVANADDRFNRRWFEVNITDLPQTGAIRISDRVYPKKLFAFYYPWYGNPDGPTGQWRAWDTKPPPNTPLLGMYDSKEEEVFRKHIEQARQAGIDGFIVSWWGFGDFTDGVMQEVILPVAAEEEFPVAIYYETVDSRSKILQDFRRILTSYGRHPAYMRVEGDPVIFVYGQVSRRFGREDWETVFKGLEEEGLSCFCQAEGLAAAYHLGDPMFDYLFDLFDGVHIYFQEEIPLTILDILNRSNALKAAVKEVNFAATVNPGFDNTPWYEEWDFNHLVIDRQEGDFYRRSWEAAVTSDPDWILLTSFNEWHEGTEVEPSEEYGELYLAITREQVGQWKGSLNSRLSTKRSIRKRLRH